MITNAAAGSERKEYIDFFGLSHRQPLNTWSNYRETDVCDLRKELQNSGVQPSLIVCTLLIQL